uniref:polysaccharide biosynthesis/export family protein n=1 Tax=Candidatus Electronema sp. TaxID=2698783 RepID=UPI004055C5E3
MKKLCSALLPALLLLLTLTGCGGGNKAVFSQNSLPAAVPAAAKDLAADAAGELRLTAGDKLTVEVWGHDNLTKQVTLDLSGAMHYPLIGAVQAQGLTIEELRAVLTKKLSAYYVNPQVTVMPLDLAGQCYYVLGDVTNPGKFTLNAKTAVIEAAAAAGGPTKSAGEFIVLLRKAKDRIQVVSIPLGFQNLGEQNAASAAMLVQSGDILFLPPSRISDVESFMRSLDSILSPLLAVERGVMYWPVFKQALQGTSGEILVQ